MLALSSEASAHEQAFKIHRPPWILSEFHGCNANASTYMLRTGQWKYIAYSDGASTPPQLFGKLIQSKNKLIYVTCSRESVAVFKTNEYLLLVILGQATVGRLSLVV